MGEGGGAFLQRHSKRLCQCLRRHIVSGGPEATVDDQYLRIAGEIVKACYQQINIVTDGDFAPYRKALGFELLGDIRRVAVGDVADHQLIAGH
jgi:hypothetical protein